MATSFATVPLKAVIKPEPFTVSIPEVLLSEFKQLLKLSKVGPVTYEGLQQDRKYGITTEWLKDAKEQWESFDWREVENEINSVPNFKAQVEDSGANDKSGTGHTYTIHFAALFSQREDAVPILMLHGWPGSFLEFLPILKRLQSAYATPSELPYHIIVPSLPGYAFSSPPPLDRDFRLEDCARILDKLMVQLGFGLNSGDGSKGVHGGYVVQGGDVGSKVARVLGGSSVHKAVRAVHLNFSIMPDPKSGSGESTPADAYNEAEKAGLERAAWFSRLGSAYAVLHATKPSTIGLALSTNPLALLAWVGEKFLDWTDADPPLAAILESVTLYWLTECFATSLWPYRQLFTPGVIGAHENPAWHIHKPLGMSWFPFEIAPVPRAWTATTGDLVFFRQHSSGGHFAAMERPDVLLADLEEFVEQVWPTLE
ncbi:Alpha/Beta hydrolase protein [Xylariaceae sp. FL1651]|nr:Alpha/Beta hydrolase protein [Xylariaceae sp. FL1651]